MYHHIIKRTLKRITRKKTSLVVRILDKYTIKNPEKCESFRDVDANFIEIKKIDGVTLYYNIYIDEQKVGQCYGCFEKEDLVPIQEL